MNKSLIWVIVLVVLIVGAGIAYAMHQKEASDADAMMEGEKSMEADSAVDPMMEATGTMKAEGDAMMQ